MADTKLLSEVLSDQGWYCIVGLKKDSLPKQTFVQTLEEANKEIDELLAKEFDVYFACAKYEKKGSRTRDNAKYFKAFWLDIDCGEGKHYESRQDALEDLEEFCLELNLPKPTTVNSGRGVHAYWALEADISREEWKPVAETLKALCVKHNLVADPVVTADEARILRVPDTLNFKTSPPSTVEIIHHAEPVNLFEFTSKLGPIKDLGPAPDGKMPLNELTMALMGNQEHRFKTIMLKTMNDVGCAQLKHIMENQDSVEEPLWRAGLSIAVFCADKNVAIHRMSQGHPDYSASATESKANEIRGPYTCDKFDSIRSGVCGECPNRGKIKSPIVLGREFLIAEEEDNLVEIAQSPEDQPVLYQIPPYPSPYLRGKKGGVYLANEGEDAELVYEHDLYVVKRMKDPNKGVVLLLRLHLPRDGVKEFTVASTDVVSVERCKETLSFHGVVGHKKQMEKIANYIITSIKELTYKTELEIMRMQFGWADNDKKFIVGDKEISADGTRYSPPSHMTSAMASVMEPQGSLEEWKKIINTYDMEGFEPHAFGFFTAFGSPLLKHLNLNGALINMVNNASGTGKTTIIKAMHSVWGHPEEMMLNWKDTQNVIMHRFGILGNLPSGLDEVTKMHPEIFSDLAYMVSQGRGKNRMRTHENAERVNLAKWALICLCSSNASFTDKLRSLKATPDGELMRLIEFEIPVMTSLSKADADRVFPGLYDNYGHAGLVYAKWLVGNLEEAVQIVRQVQETIDNAVKFTSRERFWSAVVACNIGGAYIAKKLGLHDIDIQRVLKWTIAMLKALRVEIKPPATDKTSIIGDYINENINSLAIVNGELDKRTNVEALPILEPKNGKLVIRMEPDTKKLFVAVKQFRAYCTENQITLKELLNSLAGEGIFVGTVKKRMAKGTKVPSPATDAYVFDCSIPDFIDPAEYVEAATQENAGTRDQL